jgi:hypothetical protein
MEPMTGLEILCEPVLDGLLVGTRQVEPRRDEAALTLRAAAWN